MKTIVIPDLHHYFEWVDPFLLTQEPYNEVVFLGDYFDDFHDTPTTAEGTARWLKESLKDPRRKHCMGNHDMPYALRQWNDEYNCPGFSKAKNEAINKILTVEDWNKIVPAVYSQGWLMSHAGFSYNLVEHPVLGIPTPEELVERAIKAMYEARNGFTHPWFLPGYRMGREQPGGITWCDWDDEFIPIVAIPQIVGHTPYSFVRVKRITKQRKDYCIDCHCKDVVTLTDGEVRVVKVTV